jgi:hypothetical protein
MEFLYEVGLCKHFKESNNLITIYSLAVKRDMDIIGSYVDCHGIVKRIRRDSSWGKKILALLGDAPPIEKSESQKRLTELIAGIGVGPALCVTRNSN